LNGCTALHLAAAGNQPGVVNWLLQVAGTRVCATDGAGASAAAVAAAAGSVDCIPQLLTAACDAEGVGHLGDDEQQRRQQRQQRGRELLLQRDSLGRTAFHMAAWSGHLLTWQYMIEAAFGPFHGTDGVLLAGVHKTAAEALIAAGAAAGGRTVLHFAAQGGNLAVVTAVLDLVLGEWGSGKGLRKRCYWDWEKYLPAVKMVKRRDDGPRPEAAAAAHAAVMANVTEQGAAEVPSTAVSGAAEWLMARDEEGRLAWHLAAEQVGGMGGGQMRQGRGHRHP
jgi:ankyrin repeat protein